MLDVSLKLATLCCCSLHTVPNVATAQYLILVSKRGQYGKKSNSNQVGGRYKLLFAPLVLCCPLIHSMEGSGQSEKRGYVDTDLSLPLMCAG